MPSVTPSEHRHGVLITGGTGMLGVALANALARSNTETVLLARRPPEVPVPGCPIRGDVADSALLQSVLLDHSIGIVLHLAGQSQPEGALQDPEAAFSANTAGTWHVLEAVRRLPLPVPVVVASSIAVADDVTQHVTRLTPYVTSKLCAELVARSYFETYGLEGCIVRLGNLYGPADRNVRRLIPNTVLRALAGDPPDIRGDLATPLNLLYVADAAEALLTIARAVRSETIARQALTVCNVEDVTIGTVVDTILDHLQPGDSRLRTGGNAATARPSAIQPSPVLARELKWMPRTSLQEGLAMTINWYRSHGTTNVSGKLERR